MHIITIQIYDNYLSHVHRICLFQIYSACCAFEIIIIYPQGRRPLRTGTVRTGTRALRWEKSHVFIQYICTGYYHRLSGLCGG